MIRFIIDAYIILLIAHAILTIFPDMKKYPWVQLIRRWADFTCKPIRRYLPSNWAFDISPFIVIVILKIVVVLW